MRNKKMNVSGMVLFILCSIMFLLSGCSKRINVSEDEEYIYGLNEDRTGIVPISFELTKGNPKVATEEILKELARPSEEIEYQAPIPENVKVLKCDVAGEIAYVDFSSSYLEMPPLQEKITRAAIVQSLLLVDEISGVYFQVEGEYLKNNDGTPIGLMNEDDFVQNIDSPISSYQTTRLTLYFTDKDGEKLVKEEMEVKYNTNMSREKLIVEKLMDGPKTSGVYPTLNPMATVLGVTSRDGICYVNFDSEFLNSVYDVDPEVVIYSLVNSLSEAKGIEKVQITVNGETDVRYMEMVDLSNPLEKNNQWLEETEDE